MSDERRGDGEAEGPPPPSPLTGGYLLVLLPQLHSPAHKDRLLHALTKGLITWDAQECHVDLDKELQNITAQAPEGEEAKNGERLIQFASENLVTEVLIHPQLNTLVQCMRNCLSSFTRHRHIIHAGYTSAGNGAWVLQDGTYSFSDFADMYSEHEVQRVLRAYEGTVSVDVHCSGEGDWWALKAKDPFSKVSRVRLNPPDKGTTTTAVRDFLNYLSQYLVPAGLNELLEPSDVVGNIRFSHPTLYVFPGGQGDAALFGINGFNMLVDGGFSRKACFWDFTRHLDRLDSVLMTRINNGNLQGLASLLKRKKSEQVYPQIGHFFSNIPDRKQVLSPDGDKDRDPLLINLIEQGQEMLSGLRHLGLKPQACYREPSVEPINLYHKVGHGKLDMYVLSPAKDSREVREFLAKWAAVDSKIFCSYSRKGEFNFPLSSKTSICALLVWQPANPEDNITRLLFPGSTPQQKIFEGLDRLKNLEFMKHPICSAKSLSPTSSTIKLSIKPTPKPAIIEKVAEIEKKQNETVKAVKQVGEIKKSTPPPSKPKTKADRPKEKPKTDLDSKPETVKIDKKTTEAVQKIEKEVKKEKPKRTMQKPQEKKTQKPPEKKTDSVKSSPTTPKKTVENKLTEMAATRTEMKTRASKAKASPTSTPAKSAKEENNRKVVELKSRESTKLQKAPPTKREEPKKIEKSVGKKSTASPKGVKSLSPIKAAKQPAKQRLDVKKSSKTEKDIITDSSAVSTPSTVDAELTKAKEETEKTKEIRESKPEDSSRKASEDIGKSISKDEDDEILIIEKVEIKDEITGKADVEKIALHLQKLDEEKKKIPKEQTASAIEEKETADALSQEKIVGDTMPSPETKQVAQEEVQDIIETATEIVTKRLDIQKTDSQEISGKDLGSTDRMVTSKEKDIKSVDVEQKIDESQPDERFSTTVESGATTTAPTLPEDERIPLDEIKEGIEEKHVKEETKEKEIIATPRPEQLTSLPQVPVIAGTVFDQRAQLLKDIVKTPDEVADLPVHEEVDVGIYEGAGKDELLSLPSAKKEKKDDTTEELKLFKDNLEKEDKSKDLKEDMVESVDVLSHTTTDLDMISSSPKSGKPLESDEKEEVQEDEKLEYKKEDGLEKKTEKISGQVEIEKEKEVKMSRVDEQVLDKPEESKEITEKETIESKEKEEIKATLVAKLQLEEIAKPSSIEEIETDKDEGVCLDETTPQYETKESIVTEEKVEEIAEEGKEDTRLKEEHMKEYLLEIESKDSEKKVDDKLIIKKEIEKIVPETVLESQKEEPKKVESELIKHAESTISEEQAITKEVIEKEDKKPSIEDHKEEIESNVGIDLKLEKKDTINEEIDIVGKETIDEFKPSELEKGQEEDENKSSSHPTKKIEPTSLEEQEKGENELEESKQTVMQDTSVITQETIKDIFEKETDKKTLSPGEKTLASEIEESEKIRKMEHEKVVKNEIIGKAEFDGITIKETKTSEHTIGETLLLNGKLDVELEKPVISSFIEKDIGDIISAGLEKTITEQKEEIRQEVIKKVDERKPEGLQKIESEPISIKDEIKPLNEIEETEDEKGIQSIDKGKTAAKVETTGDIMEAEVSGKIKSETEESIKTEIQETVEDIEVQKIVAEEIATEVKEGAKLIAEVEKIETKTESTETITKAKTDLTKTQADQTEDLEKLRLERSVLVNGLIKEEMLLSDNVSDSLASDNEIEHVGEDIIFKKTTGEELESVTKELSMISSEPDDIGADQTKQPSSSIIDKDIKAEIKAMDLTAETRLSTDTIKSEEKLTQEDMKDRIMPEELKVKDEIKPSEEKVEAKLPEEKKVGEIKTTDEKKDTKEKEELEIKSTIEKKEAEIKPSEENKDTEIKPSEEKKEVEIKLTIEKKEAEIKSTEGLNEDKIQSTEEKKEAEIKVTEEKREAEIKLSEEKKEAEVKPTEEKKELEIQSTQEKETEIKPSEEKKEFEIKPSEAKKESEIQSTEEKKEAETKSTEDMKEGKIKMTEENKEPGVKLAEEKKEAEIKMTEEKKETEVQLAEEKKEAEIQSIEEKKEAEIQSIEEKKEAEIQSTEETKEAEIKMIKEKKEVELKSTGEKKEAEIKMTEEKEEAELKSTEEKKGDEIKLTEKLKEVETKITEEKNKVEVEKTEEKKVEEKLKEVEIESSEEIKESEIKTIEEKKEVEAKLPEDKKEAEIKTTEEKKEGEIKMTEEKKEAEVKSTEGKKEAEIKMTEEKKDTVKKQTEEKLEGFTIIPEGEGAEMKLVNEIESTEEKLKDVDIKLSEETKEVVETKSHMEETSKELEIKQSDEIIVDADDKKGVETKQTKEDNENKKEDKLKQIEEKEIFESDEKVMEADTTNIKKEEETKQTEEIKLDKGKKETELEVTEEIDFQRDLATENKKIESKPIKETDDLGIRYEYEKKETERKLTEEKRDIDVKPAEQEKEAVFESEGGIKDVAMKETDGKQEVELTLVNEKEEAKYTFTEETKEGHMKTDVGKEDEIQLPEEKIDIKPKSADDMKEIELKSEKEKKENHIKSAEDKKDIELKSADRKKEIELRSAEEMKDIELRSAEEKKDIELRSAEEKEDAQLKIAEEKEESQLKIADEKKEAEIKTDTYLKEKKIKALEKKDTTETEFKSAEDNKGKRDIELKSAEREDAHLEKEGMDKDIGIKGDEIKPTGDKREIELKSVEDKKEIELKSAKDKKEIELKSAEEKKKIELKSADEKEEIVLKSAEEKKEIELKLADKKKDIELKSTAEKKEIELKSEEEKELYKISAEKKELEINTGSSLNGEEIKLTEEKKGTELISEEEKMNLTEDIQESKTISFEEEDIKDKIVSEKKETDIKPDINQEETEAKLVDEIKESKVISDEEKERVGSKLDIGKVETEVILIDDTMQRDDFKSIVGKEETDIITALMQHEIKPPKELEIKKLEVDDSKDETKVKLIGDDKTVDEMKLIDKKKEAEIKPAVDQAESVIKEESDVKPTEDKKVDKPAEEKQEAKIKSGEEIEDSAIKQDIVKEEIKEKVIQETKMSEIIQADEKQPKEEIKDHLEKGDLEMSKEKFKELSYQETKDIPLKPSDDSKITEIHSVIEKDILAENKAGMSFITTLDSTNSLPLKDEEVEEMILDKTLVGDEQIESIHDIEMGDILTEGKKVEDFKTDQKAGADEGMVKLEKESYEEKIETDTTLLKEKTASLLDSSISDKKPSEIKVDKISHDSNQPETIVVEEKREFSDLMKAGTSISDGIMVNGQKEIESKTIVKIDDSKGVKAESMGNFSVKGQLQSETSFTIGMDTMIQQKKESKLISGEETEKPESESLDTKPTKEVKSMELTNFSETETTKDIETKLKTDRLEIDIKSIEEEEKAEIKPDPEHKEMTEQLEHSKDPEAKPTDDKKETERKLFVDSKDSAIKLTDKEETIVQLTQEEEEPKAGLSEDKEQLKKKSEMEKRDIKEISITDKETKSEEEGTETETEKPTKIRDDFEFLEESIDKPLEQKIDLLETEDKRKASPTIKSISESESTEVLVMKASEIKISEKTISEEQRGYLVSSELSGENGHHHEEILEEFTESQQSEITKSECSTDTKTEDKALSSKTSEEVFTDIEKKMSETTFESHSRETIHSTTIKDKPGVLSSELSETLLKTDKLDEKSSEFTEKKGSITSIEKTDITAEGSSSFSEEIIKEENEFDKPKPTQLPKAEKGSLDSSIKEDKTDKIKDETLLTKLSDDIKESTSQKTEFSSPTSMKEIETTTSKEHLSMVDQKVKESISSKVNGFTDSKVTSEYEVDISTQKLEEISETTFKEYSEIKSEQKEMVVQELTDLPSSVKVEKDTANADLKSKMKDEKQIDTAGFSEDPVSLLTPDTKPSTGEIMEGCSLQYANGDKLKSEEHSKGISESTPLSKKQDETHLEQTTAFEKATFTNGKIQMPTDEIKSISEVETKYPEISDIEGMTTITTITKTITTTTLPEESKDTDPLKNGTQKTEEAIVTTETKSVEADKPIGISKNVVSSTSLIEGTTEKSEQVCKVEKIVTEKHEIESVRDVSVIKAKLISEVTPALNGSSVHERDSKTSTSKTETILNGSFSEPKKTIEQSTTEATSMSSETQDRIKSASSTHDTKVLETIKTEKSKISLELEKSLETSQRDKTESAKEISEASSSQVLTESKQDSLKDLSMIKDMTASFISTERWTDRRMDTSEGRATPSSEATWRESDDDLPPSPLSTTSHLHSPPPAMYSSMYAQDDDSDISFGKPDIDFETAAREHIQTRGETLPKDPIEKWGKPLGLPPPPSGKDYWSPFKEWGRPLHLPSPAPAPAENDTEDTSGSAKTTPKKVAKMNEENNRYASNIVIGKEANNKNRRSDSPVKRNMKDSKKAGMGHIYLDLSYVPHHGNSHYANVEFFKRVRARYYVFSGTEPSKEVFNALLEAKQQWEDKDLEVTIIPTYDTDTLGYWIAENEETLSKYKIDLSPSASRCTINLQDHDTSCSAYRLEF